MGSKYQGLPDIDTAQDIFETPDEPDALLRPADNDFEEDDRVIPKSNSDNIDSTGLPGRKRVEKVFGRGIRRKDPSDLSFRPRLPPLSRHTLSSDEDDDEDEVQPKLRESATSRLRRLKAELADLENEINAQPQASSSRTIPEEGKRKSVLPPKQPLDLISELSGLKDRLGKLDVDGLPLKEQAEIGNSGWNERLSSLNGKQTIHREDGNANLNTHVRDVSLGEIDKRLATLEDTLGPAGEGLYQNGPIIPILSKHSQLLSLLTQPRQLDAISRRIKLLLVDLDRATTASKRSPAIHQGSTETSSTISLSTNEYDNLQQLFGLINRLDTYLPILQPLLIRLKSLNDLHNEVGTIADSLKRLKATEKDESGEIKQLEEILSKLNSGLDTAVAGIMKNWESTENRIKSLEDRLGQLEK
ncbi:uncharacterized protein I206_102284 [Kwoniella pini CBS 10737]|uniref:Dynactin 2 n=1 Tax=Kwoniella pini CBS 10737 TaxID=1296096 RepID=A0A1B9HT28_9TREE|nr:uncharacterized protein I206_07654 [Kwoniella pini CBS 10737]OCF46420.1 hypothetical protein I206_07654 [Kwoniella pini CBS 10737]